MIANLLKDGNLDSSETVKDYEISVFLKDAMIKSGHFASHTEPSDSFQKFRFLQNDFVGRLHYF